MRPAGVADERWLLLALRRPDLFAGITTPEVRRRRVAEAIVAEHDPTSGVRRFETRAGTESYDGSWAELFADTYGVSLDVEVESWLAV